MKSGIAILSTCVLLLASGCAAGATPRYFQTCRGDEYYTMITCAKDAAGKPDYFPDDQSSKVGRPELSPLFTCLSGWKPACCWNDGIMQKNNVCNDAQLVAI
ncbi:hypothetical protein PGT21_015917 [Puccinia graminis f. sp. tritici]|uniref:Lipoprotein n=1 Tax=Puccinia graminis f. sp. tritici TaxID=56615 RepID=A0A5B0MMX1_PUCGR|nr:hypothetical protein PGT21_015917 [Puccinia graminis f. sp. tritici]KAA1102721.1 hypothetical protein PGTUg99_034239 [Puccinia graminis f. sp. tritici]